MADHNQIYHQELLRAVPEGAAVALDVGCGIGDFARRLARRVNRVIAVDSHAPSIERARSSSSGEGVEYVLADFMEHPWPSGGFDVVTAIASLHHLDTEAGLARMAELVKPGGMLGVIGLARSTTPVDLLYDAAGSLRGLLAAGSRAVPDEDAPPTVWPPPESFASTRRLARALLPGCDFRRRTMFRYVLIWTRPRG